jgi:imidazoleglycerol-phosphate dehydratase
MEVSAKTFGYNLGHVICEDTGWAVGAAMISLYQQRLAKGVLGNGFSLHVMDEAMCRCALSFEGRARCVIDRRTEVPERVEDMSSHDLVAFWDGLTNGGGMTIHLDILKGQDPHHMWEASFRALGESIKMALSPCPWRAGTTPGVKGF